MFQETHNRPDGTGQGELNGDPHAVQYFQYVDFPIAGIERILIGSDGLIPPGYDEQNPEDRSKILDIIKKGGLDNLIHIKKEREDSDPDFHLLRFKHSDDATGIIIQFEK